MLKSLQGRGLPREFVISQRSGNVTLMLTLLLTWRDWKCAKNRILIPEFHNSVTDICKLNFVCHTQCYRLIIKTELFTLTVNISVVTTCSPGNM